MAPKGYSIADDARPEPNHGSIATGQSHTINSEQLADLIPTINTEKLYMMEFRSKRCICIRISNRCNLKII